MLTTEYILQVIASLVGAPALIALLINIGKWTGLVNDGTAGKWSAALNLVLLIAVAAILKFYPQVDVNQTDQQLLELAKFGALVLQFITQIAATKAAHKLYQKTPLRALSARG